jgi:glycosyltransferase involved in cell wall biosynthesis
MRVGIDLRLLAGRERIAGWGMARYTAEQLHQVSRLAQGHELVLFCRVDADLAPLGEEIRSHPGISWVWLPPLNGRPALELNHSAEVMRGTAELQRHLIEQDLDVFHATAPCYLGDLVPARLDACPLVATHYDAIPLVYPRTYLVHGPEHARAYERGLELVRRAEAVVAVSEHARQEARLYVGAHGDRISVTYPVAAPCFRPLAESERERRLAPLRERFALRGEYLLCLSHLHHSKGLPTLFAAYERLSADLRAELPLVLAASLDPAEEATIRSRAEHAGIAPSLVLTGQLSDDELATLYNGATLLVHPSRREGFGLPLLEAMACGLPVIASRGGALPELAGNAAVLTPPADAAALSEAIARLHRDAELRRELGRRGRERAAEFRGEELGRRTLRAYEEAAQRRPRSERFRLAMWTPVPPQESGIAEYALELGEELAEGADIELFIDDGVLPRPDLAPVAAARHFHEFAPRHRRRPFDAILYQVGASAFHLYMAGPLRQWPGIITLHDLTWGALVHRFASIWGDEGSFERKLWSAEGDEALSEYRRIRENDGAALSERLEEFFSRRDMLAPIVVASLAQVVHLPHAAARLAAHAGSRVVVLPMGVRDPRLALAGCGAAEVRQGHGIDEGAFLVGVFGIIDPVKRLHVALRAFAALALEFPESLLVVVGSCPDSAYESQLRALAAELGVAERVLFLGRLGHREFERLLLACDVVVNLRYPFREQMSATLARAVAAGKPVVVSEIPGWEHLPSSFCLRVAPGDAEVERLTDQLRFLASEPAARQRMGSAARSFYDQGATLETMAEGYRDLLSEVCGRPLPPPRVDYAPRRGPLPYCKVLESEDLEHELLAPFLATLLPRWQSQRRRGAVPRAALAAAATLRAFHELGVLRRTARVLAVSGAVTPGIDALRSGVGELLVLRDSPHGAGLPFPSASFGAAWAANWLARTASRGEVAMTLRELARVTAAGGLVALTVPVLLASPEDTVRVETPPGADEVREVAGEARLEPVGELSTTISEATLVAPRQPLGWDPPAAIDDGALVRVRDGQVFAFLQLLLRKPGGVP